MGDSVNFVYITMNIILLVIKDIYIILFTDLYFILFHINNIDKEWSNNILKI